MARASPVTILTFTPICARGRNGGLGIFPWRIEQRQHAKKLPLAVSLGPRHAQRTKAARGEFVDRLLHGGFHLPGIGRQCQNHLRRAFRHLECLSVLAFDGGLGAFMHRVERLEMNHLISLQCLLVFQSAQHGQINGVVIVRARRQRAIEDDLIGGDIVHAERIAQRQLVLGQGAGLVRAQHVHARQFLDGHQPAHNRLFPGEQARADRHRHRQHRRHRHGNRGHGQHQGELQRGEDRVAADRSRR